MKLDVKKLSKTLSKDRERLEKRKKLIQALKTSRTIHQTPVCTESLKNVRLLKGEEKEKVLRNDYEEQESVVFLILQIMQKGEERREAISINRVYF